MVRQKCESKLKDYKKIYTKIIRYKKSFSEEFEQ